MSRFSGFQVLAASLCLFGLAACGGDKATSDSTSSDAIILVTPPPTPTPNVPSGQVRMKGLLFLQNREAQPGYLLVPATVDQTLYVVTKDETGQDTCTGVDGFTEAQSGNSIILRADLHDGQGLIMVGKITLGAARLQLSQLICSFPFTATVPSADNYIVEFNYNLQTTRWDCELFINAPDDVFCNVWVRYPES